GASDITVAGSLRNLPATGSFQFYDTDLGDNFLRLADVSVNGGSFSFVAPGDSFFTLTALTPPDVTPPSVSLTAPGDRSLAAGTVTASAVASDNVGVAVAADASANVGVAGVQFLLDDVPLGPEDTAAPFTVSWDTTTAVHGSHVLKARARDAAGNTATSAAVTVTVSNQAPTGLVAA